LLAKSIAEAENVYDHEQAYQDLRNIAKEQGPSGNVIDMLCSTATQIALDNNVDLFVVLAQTGKIARMLAKQRPLQTILACSSQQ
jgi:pyruvate kinase